MAKVRGVNTRTATGFCIAISNPEMFYSTVAANRW